MKWKTYLWCQRLSEYSETVYYSTTQFTVDDVKEIYRAFTEDDPTATALTIHMERPSQIRGMTSTVLTECSGLTRTQIIFIKIRDGRLCYLLCYTPYKDSLDYLMEMLNKGYMRWVPG